MEGKEMSIDDVLQEILRMQVEITGMFKTAQSERIERNKQLIELIMKSESRIDRINEMVLHLTHVVEDITTTYSKNINRMADNRDELIKQNTKFIEVLEAIRLEASQSAIRYDKLLDRYERLAEQKATHNSINVK